MALTDDQKKRIAQLDAGPRQAEEPGEEATDTGRVMSARVRSLALRARTSSLQTILVRLLIILVVIAVAYYFIAVNQLQEINFKKVFTAGGGSPLTKFMAAVKLQKKKTDLLEKGRGHLLVGEYEEAFRIALEIQKLDRDDSGSWELIDDTVYAVTQKAARDFESGKIEDALLSIRVALKHSADHEAANNLYEEIADRLLLEAQTHRDKREYSKLIEKAHEVLRIAPSNMAAFNLLAQTNNDLLESAEELFYSKRYFEALQKVQLSLHIDEKKPRALRLLKKISLYVEVPRLQLGAIIKRSGMLHAQIKLLDGNKVVFMKEGATEKNFRVLDIDQTAKRVDLVQIHTGQRFTIRQPRPE